MPTDMERRRDRRIECGDVDLVSRSLAGDREAFARIVETYQSLICSLAYSATGSVYQSGIIGLFVDIVALWLIRKKRARNHRGM